MQSIYNKPRYNIDMDITQFFKYEILHINYRKITIIPIFVCLFVFVALRPMSTAMVIAGRSVHLTTLFPGQA